MWAAYQSSYTDPTHPHAHRSILTPLVDKGGKGSGAGGGGGGGKSMASIRAGRRPPHWGRPPPTHLLPLLLLSLWALLAVVVEVVEAYPAYLLDPKGCVEKKLEVGFVMMGNASVADRKRRTPIRV